MTRGPWSGEGAERRGKKDAGPRRARGAAAVPAPPHVVGLALLDGYKVRWSRETVARDIVQNFFDETADFRKVSVEVDAAGRTVKVRGPSRFDLDYLRYLGATTKQAPARRTAGGFGEGFKICALILLRDYGCEVVAGSGAWEIRPFLRPMRLGRELCYEIRRLARGAEFPGSFVRLAGVDPALRAAFAGAKDLFRHRDNPRLAHPIYEDRKKGIAIYTAHNGYRGDLFYRRQHRGYLRFSRGDGLTFAYDDRLDVLEGDRDRRDLRAAAPLIAALARTLPDEVLERLIRHLRVYWQAGNGILRLLLTQARERGLKLQFPPRWLARVRLGYHLEQYAERRGYRLAGMAFGALGMPTVAQVLGPDGKPRAATALEAARMGIARDVYARLAGAPPLYERFRVVEFRESVRIPWHATSSCIVPASALAGTFEAGIAECLAALAIGGGKRAPRNGDRLTALLVGAVQHTGALGTFVRRWDRAVQSGGARTRGAAAGRAAAPGTAASQAQVEGAPPGSASEEDDDDLSGLKKVQVSILAPWGFPPAEELERVIQRLGRARGIGVFVKTEPVLRDRDAAFEYARGVPSVWIGGTEVEAVRGAPVAYAVRIFAGGRVIPGEASVAAALEKEWALSARRATRLYVRARRRWPGMERARRRYLWANDREQYRRERIREAVNQAFENAPGPNDRRDFDVRWLARCLAERSLSDDAAIPALFDAAGRAPGLVPAAERARDRALQFIPGFLAALDAAAPGISGEGEPERDARQVVLREAQRLATDGATGDALTGAAVRLAAPLLRLARSAQQLPLDSHCAGTCGHVAFTAFLRAAGTGDPEAALVEAQKTLDTAVRHALERHEQRDADGEPLDCYGFGESLKTVLGADPPSEQERRRAAVEPVVRRTWAEARAAGLGEVEAARRCLAAAAATQEPAWPGAQRP